MENPQQSVRTLGCSFFHDCLSNRRKFSILGVNHSFCSLALRPLPESLRFDLMIGIFLLKKDLPFRTMLSPFFYFLFDLFFGFPVVGGKFETITVRDNFQLCVSLGPWAILNVESFKFLFELPRAGQITKLKHFNHLHWQQLLLLSVFRLIGINSIRKSYFWQFFQNCIKLVKTHFFVAFWIFFEDFDQEGTINSRGDLADIEVFAEHHEFVYGHYCGLVVDLLKSRVLACGVAYLAIVLKNNPEVVFVFLWKDLQVELVCTDRCIFEGFVWSTGLCH